MPFPGHAAGGGGGGGNPTQEFFTPVCGVLNGVMGTSNGWTYADLNASGEKGLTSFYIPDDYSSLTEATIWIHAIGGGAAENWDIDSNYAADGEAYNQHTESDTGTTYNVTGNTMYEIDASGILTGIAAGDYCTVTLTSATTGHDCRVIGVRIKYQ
tara:strand:- start:17005 stop:17472 length:468 start_codon:yes stop_codon:yes gene_type:complete